MNLLLFLVLLIVVVNVLETRVSESLCRGLIVAVLGLLALAAISPNY